MSIRTLVVWDFDDTIIRTPGPEAFKDLFDQNIMSLDGINDNRFTFWDNPISLDPNYFQLVAKKPAIDLWKHHDFIPYNDQIVITNRCTGMLYYMQEILILLNIRMKAIFSGSDNGGKINTLIQYIKSLDFSYDKFIIIEDSIYNLIEYEKFFKKFKINTYELYFVNTKSITMIDGDLPNFINPLDIELQLIKY